MRDKTAVFRVGQNRRFATIEIASLCKDKSWGQDKEPILNETKSPILEMGQNRRFQK